LQRDSQFAVWGWADPGENVLIAFHGSKVTAQTDQNGRWSATLGPFSAGGPYDMVIAGKNRLVLRDVLLGDVWIASGQSNMEFTLGPQAGDDIFVGVVDSKFEIADAHYPQLRLFKVRHKVGFNTADDVQADAWTASTPERVANFSAVAYLFGREIHKRYHVPVGLIETSWGGTIAEAWVSEAGLKSFAEFRSAIDDVKKTDEKAVIAEHDRYQRDKAAWDKLHGTEDRGESAGRPIWADPALDAVDFSLPDDAYISLLGPSGSGKTTLLRVIAGFEEPDSGSILFHGKRLDGVQPHDRGIGFVLADASRTRRRVQSAERSRDREFAACWKSADGFDHMLQFVGNDGDRLIARQVRLHQHSEYGHLAHASRLM